MTVYHECHRICASSHLPATVENCAFASLRSGNADSGLGSTSCEARVAEVSIYQRVFYFFYCYVSVLILLVCHLKLISSFFFAVYVENIFCRFSVLNVASQVHGKVCSFGEERLPTSPGLGSSLPSPLLHVFIHFDNGTESYRLGGL